jgi:hypothetical protein
MRIGGAFLKTFVTVVLAWAVLVYFDVRRWRKIGLGTHRADLLQRVGEPTWAYEGEGCPGYFDAACDDDLISNCYVYKRLPPIDDVVIAFDAEERAMCIERGMVFRFIDY